MLITSIVEEVLCTDTVTYYSSIVPTNESINAEYILMLIYSSQRRTAKNSNLERGCWCWCWCWCGVGYILTPLLADPAMHQPFHGEYLYLEHSSRYVYLQHQK